MLHPPPPPACAVRLTSADHRGVPGGRWPHQQRQQDCAQTHGLHSSSPLPLVSWSCVPPRGGLPGPGHHCVSRETCTCPGRGRTCSHPGARGCCAPSTHPPQPPSLPCHPSNTPSSLTLSPLSNFHPVHGSHTGPRPPPLSRSPTFILPGAVPSFLLPGWVATDPVSCRGSGGRALGTDPLLWVLSSLCPGQGPRRSPSTPEAPDGSRAPPPPSYWSPFQAPGPAPPPARSPLCPEHYPPYPHPTS